VVGRGSAAHLMLPRMTLKMRSSLRTCIGWASYPVPSSDSEAANAGMRHRSKRDVGWETRCWLGNDMLAGKWWCTRRNMLDEQKKKAEKRNMLTTRTLSCASASAAFAVASSCRASSRSCELDVAFETQLNIERMDNTSEVW